MNSAMYKKTSWGSLGSSSQTHYSDWGNQSLLLSLNAVLSLEAAKTNFQVFGFTQQIIKPTHKGSILPKDNRPY